MKRALIVIAVLALSLALAATAPALTVPKTICAGFTPTPPLKLVMALKQAGSVRTAPGTAKFYTIVGRFFYGPVLMDGPLTGVGHLNGSDFHFVFTGKYEVGGQLQIYKGEGVWHLDTATGSVTMRHISTGSTGTSQSYDLQATDCSG